MPAVSSTLASTAAAGATGGGAAAAAGVATLAAAALENLSVFSVGRLPMKKAAEAASECWPALKPIVASQPALSKALFSEELPAGKWCNWTFDTVLCWPPAPANSMLATQCPEIPGLDPSKSAFKTCGPNGLWLGRNNIENEPAGVGYTDYMECFPKDTKELINEYDTFRRIALATKKMEAFGFTLSSLSLLVAIFIFFFFRQLRCTRTTIHQHLLSASLLYSILRLVKTVDMLLDEAKGQSQPAGALRGSLNESPTLCKGHIVVYEYSRTVMFMWCFIEGFYMHNIVARRVFNSTTPNFGIYALIGWGFPMVPLAIWTCVMKFVWERVHDSTGKECWYNYSNPKEGYYYIVEGMRQTFIIINVVFLANILRILVHKMRVSNSCYSDVEQVKAMVRATLVLFPLLGVTNLLFLMPAPLTSGTFVFAFWSFSTHFLGSFLGFFVSLIYCFLNKEVKECIKQKLDRRRLQRETGRAAQNRRQSHVDARFSMATIAAAAAANNNTLRASAGFMQRLSLVPFRTTTTATGVDGNKRTSPNRRSSSSASGGGAGAGLGLVRAGSQRLTRFFGGTAASQSTSGDTNGNNNNVKASNNVANGSVDFEFGRRSVGRLSQVREHESRSDGLEQQSVLISPNQHHETRRNTASDSISSRPPHLNINADIITPLLERKAASSGNDPDSVSNTQNKKAAENNVAAAAAVDASSDLTANHHSSSSNATALLTTTIVRPHPALPRPLGTSASEPHILVYNVEVELNHPNPAVDSSDTTTKPLLLLPTTSTSSPSSWLTTPAAPATASDSTIGVASSKDEPVATSDKNTNNINLMLLNGGDLNDDDDDDKNASSSSKRQSSTASASTGRGSEPMLCFSFFRRNKHTHANRNKHPGHAATAPLLRRANNKTRFSRTEQQLSADNDNDDDDDVAGAQDVELGIVPSSARPLSASLSAGTTGKRRDSIAQKSKVSADSGGATSNGGITSAINNVNVVAAAQVPPGGSGAGPVIAVEDQLLTAPSRPG